MSIRLLVVDDHPVFRFGLTSLLRTVPDIDVVGEGVAADGAVALAEHLLPDLILMDVRLRAGSGIEACREVRSRRPETRVLMLSSFSDEASVVAPFEYSAIAMGVTLDWLLWSTRPQARMLAGAAIVIAAGLYLIHRERAEPRLEAERP